MHQTHPQLSLMGCARWFQCFHPEAAFKVLRLQDVLDEGLAWPEDGHANIVLQDRLCS
jgi:hypothetical protein